MLDTSHSYINYCLIIPTFLISESDYDDFFFSSDCFFLDLSGLVMLLLKAGYVVSDIRDWGK